MSLQLYDTRSRRVRPFEPLHPGHAGVYVCGPTVQSAPHVGHLRTFVAFDLLHRWLLASGLQVTFVRNVTDIDDKIITNAAAQDTTVWALAEANTRRFTAAFDALGLLPPTVEPRATAHVPEMHALMRTLIDRGHAYASAGSVWFDVASFPAYGALSHQQPANMQPSAEGEPGKRDPHDFALWKAVKPGEPAWDSPWGPGRPGWHLECSAMAGKYLGQPFDIHGGGHDLVFPHHENELAQSAAAAGTEEMARYWMHGGLLTTGGEKMSKSLGNSFLVQDALTAVRPQVLRFHLLSAHYRSEMEYSPEVLAESAAAYDRIETFVRNALDVLGGVGEAEALAAEQPGPPEPWQEFTAALDDDLAASRGLAAVFGAVTRGNAVLSKAHRHELAGWLAQVRRMLTVLGLDPVAQWPSAAGELRPVLDGVLQLLLELRAEARSRKDFGTADSIRDRLKAAGVVIEDTPEGQRWHLGADAG